MCPQLERRRGADPSAPAPDDAPVVGDEDCLRLNVWAHTAGPARPVMVFIHGGGFQQGSGTQPHYEASKLARHGEVVVVTLNYRLGVLGLLAHEGFADDRADGGTGNFALLDQLAALRWVRDHIAAFGGDPTNVTIFGESAGAVSVCALVASPLGRGLFARAIAESGGGCAAWPALRQGIGAGLSGLARGAQIVDAAGCAAAPNVAACMRAVDASTLVRAGTRGEHTGLGLPAFGPVIDGVVLPASAAVRLREGAVDLPLIVGSNADESTLFAGSIEVSDDADFEVAMRRVLGPRAEAALAVYPPRSLGDPRDTFLRAFTELVFVCPAEDLARAAAGGRFPVFAYHFAHRPPGLIGNAVGAFHGVELAYLFGAFPAHWVAPEQDRTVMHVMQQAWSSFAHGGAPRTEPRWPAFREDQPATFVIDATPAVASDVADGRCARIRAIEAAPRATPTD